MMRSWPKILLPFSAVILCVSCATSQQPKISRYEYVKIMSGVRERLTPEKARDLIFGWELAYVKKLESKMVTTPSENERDELRAEIRIFKRNLDRRLDEYNKQIASLEATDEIWSYTKNAPGFDYGGTSGVLVIRGGEVLTYLFKFIRD